MWINLSGFVQSENPLNFDGCLENLSIGLQLGKELENDKISWNFSASGNSQKEESNSNLSKQQQQQLQQQQQQQR